MHTGRYTCLIFTLAALTALAAPASAAAVRDVTTTAVTLPAPTTAPTPPPAAEPPAPVPTATSAVTITLGTTGDFERKSVTYGCAGEIDSLTVDYINAAPNYLAMIPLDGTVLVFNTVLSASGAKYAAGKYVWWNKGEESDLYDLTQGANAKPLLACNETNNTP
jgi:membrane-bound inhibitor of C-type lysozyme